MKSHVLLALSFSLLLSLTSCNFDDKSQSDVSMTSSTLEKNSKDDDVNKGLLYVNANSGLSLREGTNLKSHKILTMPYGAEVKQLSSPSNTSMTVDGINGKMIEVVYQGATGFAFNGYLTAMAPPLPNELLENYVRRISTDINEINIIKKANKNGDDYGMTTEVTLPARSWAEIYKMTKTLFNLPKNIHPDFSRLENSETFVNKNKRERTLKDELTIEAGDSNEITSISYNYELKSYKRSLYITKTSTGYKVIENESSL